MRNASNAPSNMLDLHGTDHEREGRPGPPAAHDAKTTLEHYLKSVPNSVRAAVESLDQKKKKPSGSQTPAN